MFKLLQLLSFSEDSKHFLIYLEYFFQSDNVQGIFKSTEGIQTQSKKKNFYLYFVKKYKFLPI